MGGLEPPTPYMRIKLSTKSICEIPLKLYMFVRLRTPKWGS